MKAPELQQAFEFDHTKKKNPKPISFKATDEVHEFIDREAHSRMMDRGEFIRLWFTSQMLISRGVPRPQSRRETA